MTEETRFAIRRKLRSWENETLLQVYGGYYSRLSELNDDELEKLGLIKNEMLFRMKK